MSKSKTNFNTFLRECEEYEPVGTNRTNIFLNSNSNSNSNHTAAAAVVDSSKLILNDDNFPSLSSLSSLSSSVSSSKPKPETQNNKINFKNALSSSSQILLQQQQQQQKRLAAIAAASTCSNVSHALVKKESEYIAKKIILSKNFSIHNGIKCKSKNYDEGDDDDDENDNDYYCDENEVDVDEYE
jgi:hypothetical protein